MTHVVHYRGCFPARRWSHGLLLTITLLVSLVEASPPDPVHASVSTGTSTTEIVLVWPNFSDGGASIDSFELSTNENGNGYGAPVSIGTPANTYTVTGLNTSIAYGFRLRATNAHGVGLWGVGTDPIQPNAPKTPANFFVRAGQNESVLEFVWDNVALLAGDAVDSFVIQRIGEEDFAFKDWVTIPRTSTDSPLMYTHDFGDENNRHYKYRIASEAQTGGRSSYNSENYFVSAMGTPGPAGVRLECASESELEIRFEPRGSVPGYSQNPASYKFQLSVDNKVWQDFPEQNQPSNGQYSIVIGGPPPYLPQTVYIRMRSVTVFSNRGPYGQSVGPLPMGCPATAKEFIARPQPDATSIALTWKDPVPIHDPYTLQLRTRAEGAAVWTDVTPPPVLGDEQYLVTGLDPNIRYQFDLIAHSTGSWGSGVPTVELAALSSGGPDAPSFIHVGVGRNYTNFRLRFGSANAPSSAPVLSYKFYYQDSGIPGVWNEYIVRPEDMIGEREVEVCCLIAPDTSTEFSPYESNAYEKNLFSWRVAASNIYGEGLTTAATPARSPAVPKPFRLRFYTSTGGVLAWDGLVQSCRNTMFEEPITAPNPSSGWSRCMDRHTLGDNWNSPDNTPKEYMDLEYQLDGAGPWHLVPKERTPSPQIPDDNNSDHKLYDRLYAQCRTPCRTARFPVQIGHQYLLRYRWVSMVLGTGEWAYEVYNAGSPSLTSYDQFNQVSMAYVDNGIVDLGFAIDVSQEYVDRVTPDSIQFETRCLDPETYEVKTLPAPYQQHLSDITEQQWQPVFTHDVTNPLSAEQQTIRAMNLSIDCLHEFRGRLKSDHYGLGYAVYWPLQVRPRVWSPPEDLRVEPHPDTTQIVKVSWKPGALPVWLDQDTENAIRSAGDLKWEVTAISVDNDPVIVTKRSFTTPHVQADGRMVVEYHDTGGYNGGIRFQFSVRAVIEHGYQIGSSVEVPALEPIANTDPHPPHLSGDVVSLTEVNVTFTWLRPQFSPNPTSYKFGVRERLGLDGEWSDAPSSPLDYEQRTDDPDLWTRIYKYTLTRTGLTPGTPYYVQVRAVLDDAKGFWSDVLEVMTSGPGTPRVMLAPSSTTNGTLVASWEAIADRPGASVDNYVVQYYPLDYKVDPSTFVVPAASVGSAMSHSFSVPINETAYLFRCRVAAVDSNGNHGPWSLKSVLGVAADMPASPGAPTAIERFSPDPATLLGITVSWSSYVDPRNREFGSSDIAYHLQSRHINLDGSRPADGGWKVHGTYAHVTSLIDEPLAPGLCFEYRMAVEVNGLLGEYGPSSSPCERVNTPLAVEDFNIVTTGTTATFSWNRNIVGRKEPFYYHAQVDISTDAGASWSRISPLLHPMDSLSYTISPASTYVARVRIVDRETITGPWTSSLSFRTAGPAKPAGVSFLPQHSTEALNVTWPEVLPTAGDPIVRYAVLYRPADDNSQDYVTKYTTGPVTHLLVDGLDRDKLYVFKVAAEGQARGWSPLSDVSAPTSPLATFSPDHIELTVLGYSTVHLQWNQEYVDEKPSSWVVDRRIVGGGWYRVAVVDVPWCIDEKAATGVLQEYRVGYATPYPGAIMAYSEPVGPIDLNPSSFSAAGPNPPAPSVHPSPDTLGALELVWDYDAANTVEVSAQVGYFEIDQRSGHTVDFAIISAVQVPANTSSIKHLHVVSGLSPAVLYQFRVRAVSTQGRRSVWSTPTLPLANQAPGLLPLALLGPGHNAYSLEIQVDLNASPSLETVRVDVEVDADPTTRVTRVLSQSAFDENGKYSWEVVNNGPSSLTTHAITVSGMLATPPTSGWVSNYEAPSGSVEGVQTVLKGRPGSPPDFGLETEQLGFGFVRVSWGYVTTYPYYLFGAPTTHYVNVEFRKAVGSGWSVWQTATQSASLGSSITLPRLVVGEKYQLRSRLISSSSIYGFWKESEPFVAGAPNPPGWLFTNTLTNSPNETAIPPLDIFVSWPAVESQGLTGLELRYRLQTGGPQVVEILPPTALNFTISNVGAGMWEIEVAAISAAYGRGFFRTTVHNTLSRRSGFLRAPNTRRSSGATTIVAIHDFQYHDVNLHAQFLMQEENGPFTLSSEKTTNPRPREHHFTYLKGDTRYTFRVRERNSGTEPWSEWSAPSEYRYPQQPGHPLNVNAIVEAKGLPPKRGITLTWDAPNTYAMPSQYDFKTYYVQISNDTGDSWQDIPVGEFGLMARTLRITEGLVPRQTYMFRVMAREPSKWGTGGWSVATTPVNLGTPLPPTIDGIKNTGGGVEEILVEWSPPVDFYLDNDPVAVYRLQWWYQYTTSYEVIPVLGNTTSLTVRVPFLRTCTYPYGVTSQIVVQMQSESAIYGVGQWSSPLTFELANPPEPVSLELFSVSPSSLLARWKLPEPYRTRPVTQYAVEFKQGSNAYGTSTFTSEAAVLLEGLTSVGPWQFRVRALRTLCSSQLFASNMEESTTIFLGATASPPMTPKAPTVFGTGTSSSEVEILTEIPDGAGQEITSGVLEYRVTGGNDTVHSISFDTDVTTVPSPILLVKDLDPDNRYIFRVSYESSEGKSGWSSWSPAVTPRTPPSLRSPFRVGSGRNDFGIEAVWEGIDDVPGTEAIGYIETQRCRIDEYASDPDNECRSHNWPTGSNSGGVNATRPFTVTGIPLFSNDYERLRARIVGVNGTYTPWAYSKKGHMHMPWDVENVQAKSVAGQFHLSWDMPGKTPAMPAITGYLVEQSKDGLVWTPTDPQPTGTNTELFVTPPPGTPLKFRVSAINPRGEGGWSDATPYVSLSAPNPVQKENVVLIGGSDATSVTVAYPKNVELIDNDPVDHFIVQVRELTPTPCDTAEGWVICMRSSSFNGVYPPGFVSELNLGGDFITLNGPNTLAKTDCAGGVKMFLDPTPYLGMVGILYDQAGATQSFLGECNGPDVNFFCYQSCDIPGPYTPPPFGNVGTISGADTSDTLELTGLEPSKKYELRLGPVSLVNGQGQWPAKEYPFSPGAPDPPTNIDAAPSLAGGTNYAVQLSWDPSLAPTDGPVLAYKLEASIDGGFTWLTNGVAQPVGDTNGVSVPLDPNTTPEIRFRVRAVNQYGQSSWAELDQLVRPGAPVSPVNARLQRRTTITELRAEWDDSGVFMPTDSLVGFELEITSDGGLTWELLSPQPVGLATSHIIANLEPTTPYAIRVRSISANYGRSKFSLASAPMKPAGPVTINKIPPSPLVSSTHAGAEIVWKVTISEDANTTASTGIDITFPHDSNWMDTSQVPAMDVTGTATAFSKVCTLASSTWTCPGLDLPGGGDTVAHIRTRSLTLYEGNAKIPFTLELSPFFPSAESKPVQIVSPLSLKTSSVDSPTHLSGETVTYEVTISNRAGSQNIPDRVLFFNPEGVDPDVAPRWKFNTDTVDHACEILEDDQLSCGPFAAAGGVTVTETTVSITFLILKGEVNWYLRKTFVLNTESAPRIDAPEVFVKGGSIIDPILTMPEFHACLPSPAVITFTTSNEVKPNDWIYVTLPPGFQINQGGPTTASSNDIGGGLEVHLGNVTQDGARTLRLHRLGGLSMTVLHVVTDLTLTSIRAPNVDANKNLIIATVEDGTFQGIDGPTQSAVKFVAPRGQVTDVSVHVNQEIAGAVGLFTMTFTLETSLQPLGAVVLTLPSTMKLNANFPTAVVGLLGIDGSTNMTITGSEILVQRLGDGQPTDPVNPITVTLSNVRFPRVQGVTAGSLFSVYSTCTTGSALDGAGSPSDGIEFHADPLIAVQVKRFSTSQSDLSRLVVSFVLPLDLFPEDSIRVTLPPEFNLPSMPSQVSVNSSTLTGTYSVTKNGMVILIKRNGDGGVLPVYTSIKDLDIGPVATPLPGTTESFKVELLTPTSDVITDALVDGIRISAGIQLSTIDMTLDEGATTSYEIVLDYALNGVETLSLDLRFDPSELTTNVQSMRFTSENWNVPQTVTVTAVDNETPTGDHTVLIQHAFVDGPEYFVFVHGDEAIPGKMDVSVLLYDNDLEPSIFSFDPKEGPLFGGAFVTIRGVRLGFKSGEVKDVIVGGVSCKNSSLWVDPSEIGCVLAASSSKTAITGPVSVTLYPNAAIGRDTEITVTAPQVFTYKVPVISDLTPITGPVAGSTRITITGNYLGTSSDSVLDITVAGVSCKATSWWANPTTLGCVTSPGTTGLTGPAVVHLTGGYQLSTEPVTFLYTDPPLKLLGIEPSTGTALGGQRVRIWGTRIATSKSDVASVTLAGQPCVDIVVLNVRELVCRTVKSPQTNGTVVVTVKSQTSNENVTIPSDVKFAFSYPVPEVRRVRPTVISPAGGTKLTVRGSFFGPARVDSLRVYVQNVACQDVRWQNEGELTCVTPPRAGNVTSETERTRVSVTVSVYGRTSPESGFSGLMYGQECSPPEYCGWDAKCLPSTFCLCDLGWAKPPACTTPAVALYLPPVASADTQGRSNTTVDVLGPGIPRVSNKTSEDGTVVELSLQLFIQPSPQVPVVFSCSSSNRSEAVVENSPVIVDPDNWKIPYPVRVRGIPDSTRDGPAAYEVKCSALGGGAKFENAPPPAGVTLVNLDSSPDVFNIQPKVVALEGSQLTITGRNFDSSFTVAVNNKTVPFIIDPTPITNPSTAANRLGLLQSNTTGGGGSNGNSSPYHQVVATIPSLPAGYHTLSISNAGGTETILGEILYASNACPDPGFIGDRDNCQPCPSGATCPGGGRIIPEAGNWNSGERSGFVGKCHPASRCMGSVNGSTVCAPKYTGDFCAKCDSGYVMVNMECEACPDPSLIAAYMIVAVLIWSGIGLLNGMVSSSHTNSYLTQVTLTVQMAAAIGGMRSPKVPNWVNNLYGILPVINADYRFLRTDCVSVIPWETGTVMRLSYLVLILVWLYAMLAISYVVRRKGLEAAAKEAEEAYFKSKHPEEDDDGDHVVVNTKAPQSILLDEAERAPGEIQAELEQDKEELSVFFKHRTVRCVLIWVTVMYYSLTNLAFELVGCTKVGGQWVSLNHQDRACYNGFHYPMAVLGYCILLFITLGLPVSIFYILRRSRDGIFNNEYALQRYGMWFELATPRNLYYILYEFVVFTFLASGNAVMQRVLTPQLIVLGVVMAGRLVFLAARQPLARKLDNIVHCFVTVSLAIGLAYNYILANDLLAGYSWAETLMIIIALIILTICVIYLSVYAVMIVMVKEPMERQYNKLKNAKEALEAVQHGEEPPLIRHDDITFTRTDDYTLPDDRGHAGYKFADRQSSDSSFGPRRQRGDFSTDLSDDYDWRPSRRSQHQVKALPAYSEDSSVGFS